MGKRYAGAEKLGNERRYIYKDPRQDSEEYFVYEIWAEEMFYPNLRDLYGDAMLVLGRLRAVLKPLGRVTGVFLSPVLIPYSSQPLPNQFSCLSQNTLSKY